MRCSRTLELSPLPKQVLETFREQAEKFQGVSQEAYEVYSKKAAVILTDATEQLKVLADKTKNELSVAAKEITISYEVAMEQNRCPHECSEQQQQ